MNWVGGSRNRLVMKNDAKRQREFFEKRKMQQRLKNLGIALPASPQGSTSGSMDLVTLFIVNQIAAKKENKADPPTVAVLGSSKGGSKQKRYGPLVLPMSPCSPSQLCLVESQPQCSVQETRKRKHVIPQGFKYRQLSPVPESAFSDNSASDYLPPITDPLSPFSSTSPAPSEQGMFPLQLNLQQRSQTQARLHPQCSPPPWDPGLERTEFQPFSQPRGMIDSIPWSCGSNLPLSQPETPTAASVLFGSSGPDDTVARDHARQEVSFSFYQPEDREELLDFTLNPSGADCQIEEDVFRGFGAEECEREASHFGRRKLKIYLKDERAVKSSAPQTVPDSECVGEEFSNCTDMNFSCLEPNNGPMNCCDCSPNCSCRAGYLSSDSYDEEEGRQPSVQAASSYMDQACCADVLSPNLGSQGNPKQRQTLPGRLTPPLKHKMNLRADQKGMEDAAFPDNLIRSNSLRARSHTAQLDSAETQSSEPCKCNKTSSETQDAGTQTADVPMDEKCDASTQCSFVGDGATIATGFNLFLPPIDVSVPPPATGRQYATAAEPNTLTPSLNKARSGVTLMTWGKKIPRAASVSGSSIINKFTANNTDGKVILQRPINPLLDALSTTVRDGRDERGQRGCGRPTSDLSNEVREEDASVTRISRLSEEAETIEEIADILLLLKQKRK